MPYAVFVLVHSGQKSVNVEGSWMPQCLLFAVEPLLHSARNVLSKDFSFPDCKLKKKR